MAIENVKGSLEYSKDLQSLMVSNPLKKETTSEAQRQKSIQEAASKVDAKALMTSYVMEFQMSISSTSENNFNSQNGISLLE
ncbi:MAG: hydrogenase-4 component G, partial [Helicobacter sp.]|nr:hydrogenase-4 component G [Helicobacter sp.]